MTREEKIEVMFESILSEMERISKQLIGADPEKTQNDQSVILQKCDALIQKLNSLKIPIYKPDLDPIHNKLDVILTQLKSPVIDDRIGIPENQNSQSLPSSKRWLFRTYPSRVALVFSVLFFFSIAFNYYLFRNYDQYKQSHLKYLFIYFSGNKKYLDELDSIWSIDSERDKRLRFIEQRKEEIATFQNPLQKTDELYPEFDNLKLKVK